MRRLSTGWALADLDSFVRQSGHYRSAAEDAASKSNAETQNKVARLDPSETKLSQEVCSEKAAEFGGAGLWHVRPDGSATCGSVQRGVMALAEGVFAGVWRPLTHEAGQELDKEVALEQLAALSVPARLMDESEVEHAGGWA